MLACLYYRARYIKDAVAMKYKIAEFERRVTGSVHMYRINAALEILKKDHVWLRDLSKMSEFLLERIDLPHVYCLECDLVRVQRLKATCRPGVEETRLDKLLERMRRIVE